MYDPDEIQECVDMVQYNLDHSYFGLVTLSDEEVMDVLILLREYLRAVK